MLRFAYLQPPCAEIQPPFCIAQPQPILSCIFAHSAFEPAEDAMDFVDRSLSREAVLGVGRDDALSLALRAIHLV